MNFSFRSGATLAAEAANLIVNGMGEREACGITFCSMANRVSQNGCEGQTSCKSSTRCKGKGRSIREV